jgi:hypothetical protein
MPITGSPIYLSTMLLEKNRSNGKGPSLLVSDWMEPIGEAGYGGLEIGMKHLLFSSRSEWELIKERGLESDLASALIASPLPADTSDKSQRLRDALLEACDYFRPEGLKLGVPSGEEGIDFLKTWVQDVPRETAVFCDCREGESGVDRLAALRQALPGGRFRAVIHPFLLSPADFDAALKDYGDFIGNLGVQARKGNAWSRILDDKDASLRIVAVSRKRGYKGTWSLECTKGAGQAGEDIDELFDNSEADLNFLTEILARTALEKV